MDRRKQMIVEIDSAPYGEPSEKIQPFSPDFQG